MGRGLLVSSLALHVHLSLFLACGTTISPGSSLSVTGTNKSWSSPNRTFSLGFLQVSDNPSFIFAIAYSSIPIWIAGGADTVVDSATAFHFSSSGDLRLVNSSGGVVWKSGTGNIGISGAELDDSGNLVLRRGTTALWSTFDNPSHTIVPNQNFTTGKTLRRGLYTFSLQRSGNLTLRWNNSIVYWTTGLNSSFYLNLTSPSVGLQSIGILNLYDPLLPANGALIAYSSDYGNDMFRFVRLDDDGNLRIYSSSSGGGAPTPGWSAVEDQCEVYGYCGKFGICSYNDSGPICRCPSQNFDPVDRNDMRKGCKRKIALEACAGNETMLELTNNLLLTFLPESSSQVFDAGDSACKLNCLTSIPCFASTTLADGSGKCYWKLTDYLSGYQSPIIPSSSYLKICGPAAPSPPVEDPDTTSRKFPAWIVIVVIAGVLSGLVVLEGCIWWCCCRNPRKLSSDQYALIEYASGAPIQFNYRELHQATKGFKEKLGEGGFGSVYRGVLPNRAVVVAVKRLEGIEQGEKQFRMEVATISSTHHLNLVRLIGFCSESRHRLLVYEFMKNGSLDNFIFSSSRVLSWEDRFKIAIGTARGITYLHEECRDCIVHCDIKPENILLDENHNARVSDFGLAKLINANDQRYRTMKSVRGTRGYLAPEWLANHPITSKSDVYSYGMILLEIVSGRRNYDVSMETNQRKFSAWAYGEFEKGDLKNIVDKKMSDSELEMEQVRRMIEVSFWCIQEQPSQRPRMGKVLQMLEGIAEIEKLPPPRSAGIEDSRSICTPTTITERLPSSLHPSTELQ